MKNNFIKWYNVFKKDDLISITENREGLLWFKLKSILRKELISKFISEFNIDLKSKNLKDIFIELFFILIKDVEDAHLKLNKFIYNVDKFQRKQINTQELVNELYKLKFFNWGGDYSNALDKYLVNNFIKVFFKYDFICSKIETEINQAVLGYVMCSWYNHWSSILIENIFKEHKNVLPTVGQVKKVDFFINEIPFDLKVTYLPTNFVEKKRKESNLKSELQELKSIAKELNIYYNSNAKINDLMYELQEKIKDKNDIDGYNKLNRIKNFRIDLINDLIKNPIDLIKNLYEEQGELRFDAANRLFIILIDKNNFEESWKLKRNLDLLKPVIKKYLDNFNKKNIKDLKINFTYKDKGNFEAI